MFHRHSSKTNYATTRFNQRDSATGAHHEVAAQQKPDRHLVMGAAVVILQS
jgi:hypothetical protein